MPKPDAIADHLCELIAGLTSARRGRGPHWIAVSTVARELRKADIVVDDADLQAAIALCVERHVMKAEGRPAHSIAVWQKDWKIERER
jgi:hypothetical protein